nr:premnaspirodiene oxygenase-like [Tanacetum cinerariifolium]
MKTKRKLVPKIGSLAERLDDIRTCRDVQGIMQLYYSIQLWHDHKGEGIPEELTNDWKGRPSTPNKHEGVCYLKNLFLYKKNNFQAKKREEMVHYAIGLCHRPDRVSGGTDTSSNTIEWPMTKMIRHPRVMKKAQDEVRKSFKGERSKSSSFCLSFYTVDEKACCADAIV